MAIAREEDDAVSKGIRRTIGEVLPQLKDALVGFYLPIRGEVALHGLGARADRSGRTGGAAGGPGEAAAARVRAWQPEARMARGVWNFPIPAEGQVVRPGALLVPLVGFDSRGYRPRLPRRPLRPHARRAAPEAARDRVGYELGRLATIHPQPHGTPWTHW